MCRQEIRVYVQADRKMGVKNKDQTRWMGNMNVGLNGTSPFCDLRFGKCPRQQALALLQRRGGKDRIVPVEEGGV